MGNPVGFCFFLFFPGRKGNGSSFLFRRKEIVPLLFFLEEKKQKKIICGTGFPAAPAAFAGLQHKNGRLTYEPAVLFVSSWMCGKPPSVRKAPSAALSFVSFLQEKKSFPFFLEEKKQKKIICRICFCASLYILRNPVAQNGRLTYEPTVFSFQAGCAGNRLLFEMPPQPLCLLFLFFKKRNRSPSFLFRRKEAKENHLRNRIPRCARRFRGSATQERTARM